MTTKIAVYNGALRELGERKLASITENREPRRLLDDVYDSGVRQCLAKAQWRFARRTVELTAETDIEPAFGHPNAFAKPTDHIRTCKLTSDGHMNSPALEYNYEAGYFYADIDPIYLSYVSDHVDWGFNLADWPDNFALFVETYLATLIVNRITGSKTDVEMLHKLARRRLTEAASTDAMEDPTQFTPLGSWARARLGGRSAYRDRGSRSRLIG